MSQPLSSRRREFQARRRRTCFWWTAGLLAGIVVLIWSGPVVRVAVDRVVSGPGAQIEDLDELVGVVGDLQDRLLAVAAQGALDVDFLLQQVAALQAVLDGARAGYVEGGADPDLTRVRRIREDAAERIDRAVSTTGGVGAEPGGLWAGCQAQAGAPVGTREHVTDALRVCVEDLDMSGSAVLVRNMNDVGHYLNSITGNYSDIYSSAFGVASGGR